MSAYLLRKFDFLDFFEQVDLLMSLLFHYAGPEGLIGILRNRKIWASNIAHMNDSLEDNYGICQIVSFLAGYARSRNGPQKKFSEDLLDTFRRGPGGRHRFAFCLSEEGDLLSQWRGYASEGGYSMGFEREVLENLATSNGLKISNCVYEKSAQMKLITEKLGTLLDSFSEWGVGAEELEKRKRDFLHASESIRSVIKHPSFAEEKEWRLHGAVATNDQRSRARCTGPYIHPYVEMDLNVVASRGLCPVEKIIVGPGLDFGLASGGISHLLSSLDSRPKSISPSASPFR